MLLCGYAADMSDHTVSCISLTCCYIAGVMEPHVDSVKYSDWTSVFYARRPDHDRVFAKHGTVPFTACNSVPNIGMITDCCSRRTKLDRLAAYAINS